jgi:hypothetical protein
MRRLRSEDSAAGKTEGGRIELCRSHALRMTQPHADALAYGKRDATQAIGDLRRLERRRVENPLTLPAAYQLNERGMARQGFDRQITQYHDRGWRATFYTTGMEHSPTSATGTGWERTAWHAVQRAAWGGARARSCRLPS